MVVRLRYRRPLIILACLHAAMALATLICEKLYQLFPRSRFCYELATAVNISGEGNLASFLQSFTLALTSLLSLCLAAAGRGETRAILTTLALCWGLMSMDEFAMVHERMILPLRNTFQLGGAFYYSWVVLGLPVALALAAWFWRASRHLPSGLSRGIGLGGVLFFSGSLGVEMLTASLRDSFPDQSYGQLVLCVVEESAESLGALIWLAALASQLAVPEPVGGGFRESKD